MLPKSKVFGGENMYLDLANMYGGRKIKAAKMYDHVSL